MLQYVNERKRVHIVTIEDPIEYIFNDDKATINQREIGIDCLNFNDALRALVRENPDVVLVGEMRDYETFEAAIRAAETGHLVFGTIHASSAWQTFGRIYDLFPENEREQLAKTARLQPPGDHLSEAPADAPREHRSDPRPRDPAQHALRSRSTFWKLGKANCSRSSSRVRKKAWSTSRLLSSDLVEEEFIHQDVALAATPKPEELKMRLKGIS